MNDSQRRTAGNQRDTPFDRLAGEYDRWFEQNAVFGVELACLRALRSELPEPRLEIGVGPGRFAEALGFGFGVDPAFGALRLAARRGIRSFCAVGEALPFANGCIGTVALLFSLCFVEDPAKVLLEVHRVLDPAGMLVIGMVPSASPWGRAILGKKRENNPFYRRVNLLKIEQALDHLQSAGFTLVEQRSALLQPPSGFAGEIDSRSGVAADAGFVVLMGQKRKREV